MESWSPLVWGIRVSNETGILFPVTPSPISLLMSFVNEKGGGGAGKSGGLLLTNANRDSSRYLFS